MRFTRTILCVFATSTLLSGCAYIIPPERNAPRHNEVRGDVRRPEHNPGGGPARAAAEAPAAAPMAEQQMASAATDLGARRVPVENQPYTTAAMGYDPITDVPPRPATRGPASVPTRLRATQADLERERGNAYDARDALGRDAAAEPVLSPMPAPRATTPPPEPMGYIPPPPDQQIAVAPILPPPPGLPSLNPITERTTPPLNLATPAPRAMSGGSGLRSDFDPLAAADNAPISAAPHAARAPVVITPRYATSGYIPPSRYQERRF